MYLEWAPEVLSQRRDQAAANPLWNGDVTRIIIARVGGAFPQGGQFQAGGIYEIRRIDAG
jgi:hypothetical protein